MSKQYYESSQYDNNNNFSPYFDRFSDVESDTQSPPPYYRRQPRRMRRLLFRVTRKALITVTAFGILFFLLFRNQDAITSPSVWSTSSVFDCPSNRTNPFGIQPPIPADPLYLTNLWSDLKKLFDKNHPLPKHLDHPKHKGSGPPPRDKLGSFFALTDEDAKATRNYNKEVIKNLPSYPNGWFRGRGIVMLAGGRYSEYAATSLGMIREMQSKLPVEVWIKDEEEDMPGWCDELATEGMACRRLSDYMDADELKHPYALKIFTILFSSFNEVLFLDADSCPIVNPDQIFESEVYKNNGAILWPDYWKHTGSPWLPYLIGTSPGQSEMYMDEQSIESGQLVWHKERHWRSLILAVYYNYFGPDFWYTVFNNGWAGWGDKDTFPMALKALQEPYFQVKHGIVTTFVSGTAHGIGMMQANPQNETHHAPMFLHSNIIKWSMRNLACKDCEDIPGHSHHYHLEDEKSQIYSHLTQGQRIFSLSQMDETHVDPEPIMWKAVEWTACKSAVWGNDQVCDQVRGYMQKALGFEFRKSKIASAVGNGKQFCMIQPTVFKRPEEKQS